MSDRYQSYREVALDNGFDAVALVPGANFERLFNVSFHQNERPLLVLIPVSGAPSAVVPNLELGSFASVGFEGNIYDWRDQQGYRPAFDALLEGTAVRRLGVEGQLMRVFVAHALEHSQPGIELIDAQQAISATRVCKNPAELEALREAIRLSEQALGETIAEVRIGQSETRIRNLLTQRLFAAGADALAFTPIVAAADNAARPHALSRPDYQLRAGDTLLIDFGGRFGGLCADITRTFFVGHCDAHQRAVYETVLAANRAALEVVAPGVSAHAVDDAATCVLEASPFRAFIRHKTGHGLGRDIHEDPYIMRGNRQILAAGMVFTVEPGLYQNDVLGVRIEDDVLVTARGAEALTGFDRSLTVLDGSTP